MTPYRPHGTIYSLTPASTSHQFRYLVPSECTGAERGKRKASAALSTLSGHYAVLRLHLPNYIDEDAVKAGSATWLTTIVTEDDGNPGEVA